MSPLPLVRFQRLLALPLLLTTPGLAGIAACNIGGTTVHSFAGVGLGTGSPEELANRVRRNRRTCQRWVNCRVLIIDGAAAAAPARPLPEASPPRAPEVSMLDADLFDKLELVARRARGRPEPFGGVQVVLCGDFFQIPPVGLGQSGVKFCFEASSWPSVVKRQVVLRQVFRQRDERLVRTLNQIRHVRARNALPRDPRLCAGADQDCVPCRAS